MFPATIEGQRYIFIDTPGFNDSDPSRTDIDVFQEILKWFETMSPYCDLAGLLYVYDMMNPRFTGSADLILKMISALCGEEYFRNVTILTTKWSQVGPGIHTAVVNSQEAELIKGPWKEMIAGGARVHRHRGLIDLEIVPPEFKAVVDAQRKIEQDDVREMIRFYRTSETKVAPQIQHELRSGTEVMRTAAASVLLRFRGLDIQQNEDNADAHSLILLQPRPESTIEDVTALESRYAYMPGYFPDRQENPARRSTRRHPPDGLPRLLGGSPLSWWATFCNAIFAFLTGS